MKCIFCRIWIISFWALIVSSCGEEHSILSQVQPAEGARLKIFHAAPGGPGIVAYVNDQKITAALPSTTGLVTPLTYPNAFPSTGYSVLPAGESQIKITTLVGSTTANNILTENANLERDKYYSFFVAGNGSDVSAFMVEDNLTPLPDASKVYIRFVHLIPNAASYHITSPEGIVVVPEIGYQAATEFIPVNPASSGSNYVFQLREPGVDKAVATLTNATLSAGRVYTIQARGLVGGTGATAPTLSLYVNN